MCVCVRSISFQNNIYVFEYIYHWVLTFSDEDDKQTMPQATSAVTNTGSALAVGTPRFEMGSSMSGDYTMICCCFICTISIQFNPFHVSPVCLDKQKPYRNTV